MRGRIMCGVEESIWTTIAASWPHLQESLTPLRPAPGVALALRVLSSPSLRSSVQLQGGSCVLGVLGVLGSLSADDGKPGRIVKIGKGCRPVRVACSRGRVSVALADYGGKSETAQAHSRRFANRTTTTDHDRPRPVPSPMTSSPKCVRSSFLDSTMRTREI